MGLKQIVMLALIVSIFGTVFGFGLRATKEDLLYLIRRPGLLVRSLLSVFVIMPVIAVALVEIFNFRPEVEILLVALAISPVPPILPKKESKFGGHGSYALGLLAILSLVSIVAVPLVVEILQRVFGRELTISTVTIAAAIVKTVLAPLVAGMAVRAWLPALAEHIERPVALAANILLPLAALLLVAGALPAMWATLGNLTLFAVVIFTVAGLAVGHVLGGPNPDHAVVLALSTASRHPAIALAIASATFPDQQFGPLVLLYLVVAAIVGFPYLTRQRRQMADLMRAAS